MAKENTVELYGRVRSDPTIRTNDDGEYILGFFTLDTIRRTYITSEYVPGGDLRGDCPLVLSRNASVIQHGIRPINKGDMVRVEGTLSTKDISRSFTCKSCGHVTRKPGGVMVYVDPVFVEVCKTGLSDTEAVLDLQVHSEVSNKIMVFGTVCKEPGEAAYYDPGDPRYRRFEFQIAVNRLRHVLEDGPDKRTDFPHVKCYGKSCDEYYQAIHKYSTVFINGAIQTRDPVTIYCRCEKCGQMLQKFVSPQEIVPYHIEYVDKCNTNFEPIDISEFRPDVDGKEDSDGDIE